MNAATGYTMPLNTTPKMNPKTALSRSTIEKYTPPKKEEKK
tara:strand:+ start:297 stop:419 length:123 start_codon:yes stop_codon:yes gene_type:complete